MSSQYRIKNLAVVLFAYNEQGNLKNLLRRIHTTLKWEAPDTRVQYAVCIQGDDNTFAEASAFAKGVGDEADVHIEHSVTPLGIRGACVRAFGLVQGKPDAYLMMDCDLNHQPEQLPEFLASYAPKSVVVGSRFCPGGQIVGMPHWKHTLSILFNKFASILFNVPVADKTSGYRLIAGDNIGEIASQVEGRGFDFYIEFLLRLRAAGLATKEIPITFLVRTEGESKMRLGKTIVDYLKLSRRLRRVAAMSEQGAAQSSDIR